MRKRKAMALLCLALLLLGGCGTPGNSCERYASEQELQGRGVYTPGDYRAAVWGFGGNIVVEAQFSETDLIFLRIEGKEESGKGGRAIRRLCGSILASQSPEADAVSGATITSKAVIKAAKSCFSQAEGDSQS